MLTNSMETQMVRALDISIGGRSVPKQPMAFVKSSLSGTSLGSETEPATTDVSPAAKPTSASKCPFSSTVNEAYASATVQETAAHFDDANEATAEPECPFPHGGTETRDKQQTNAEPGTITWAADATERVERIPGYIRPMVIKGVEEFARSAGLTTIDAALMESLKERFGGM